MAVVDPKKMKNACEECGLKTKNYGTMQEKRRRWCLECSKAHNGVLISALTAGGNKKAKPMARGRIPHGVRASQHCTSKNL